MSINIMEKRRFSILLLVLLFLVGESHCRKQAEQLGHFYNAKLKENSGIDTSLKEKDGIERLSGKPQAQSYVVYLGGPELSSESPCKKQAEQLGHFYNAKLSKSAAKVHPQEGLKEKDGIERLHGQPQAQVKFSQYGGYSAEHPKVMPVLLQQGRKLHTTRGRIPANPYGEDTIADKEYGESKAKVSGSHSKTAPSESYRDQYPRGHFAKYFRGGHN